MKQTFLILTLAAAAALPAPASAQGYGYYGWRQPVSAAPCPNYRRTHWEVSHDAQGRRVVRTWTQTSAGTSYSESYQ